MIKIKDHIIFDQIDSWPQPIIKIIMESENSLKEFLNEEKKRILEPNFLVRFKFPPNPNEKIWNSVANKIESVLCGKKLAGIHCTKLMDYEIEEITKNGLIPLDKSYAIDRVNKLYENGLISEKLKKEILNKSELEEDERVGKVFTFYNISTLQFEGGLRKIFTYWGGESIYQYLEDPSELRKIGIPCIIFISMDIENIPKNIKLGERFLCIFFNDYYCSSGMEFSYRGKLDVVKVIQRDNKLFNDLTNIESWDLYAD